MVNLNPFLQIVMTGMATGFGSALGSFFATKYALKELKRVKKIHKIVKRIQIKKLKWRIENMGRKEDKYELIKGNSAFGSWAFIIGVIIAIISGFFSLGPFLVSALVVMGLLVGFLNITGQEIERFLFSGLSLVIVTALGGNYLSNITYIGSILNNVFGAIMVFVIPAVIVVALKIIYSTARN